VNLLEALVATGRAVAAGCLLLDGRWLASRLDITVCVVGGAVLVGHGVGVVAATLMIQPASVSLSNDPVVVVGGVVVGSLAGALPVGVCAGAAVRRLRAQAG
jgi:hypothetical protein